MPPLDVFQTSTRERGQIYIPQVNWLLLIAVLALVLGFQSSSALASAYGFAVTGTMTITTILAAAVMRGVWRWQWPTIAVVLIPIMTVDLALFSSNALKIPTGGWFPLVIGLVVFTIMTTWRAGRRLVLTRLASQAVPLASFLAACEEAPEARVSGTAVFLTTQTENVPVTLHRNLKHNKVLHHTVLLVRVVTENIPRVAGADRIKARGLGSGFWQIEASISVLPRRQTYRGSWAGRRSRGWNSIRANSLSLSAAPTSNRACGPGWHGGANTFTPASRASRRGQPSSSASRRTA
jgi:KUP system potassium uptake protein